MHGIRCFSLQAATHRKIQLKNDRVDAVVLGELLRTNYLSVSHMIDELTRERKLLAMERARYARRRARVTIGTRI